MVLSASNYCSLETVQGYNQLPGVGMTADDIHELHILPSEEPKMMVGRGSPQEEKQISVDPVSLRESSSREASFNFMLPRNEAAAEQLPPLSPAVYQLMSCSLPNSACSSPRFSFGLRKKKWKNESQTSPRQLDNLAVRHSTANSFSPLQQLIHLRRSRSCAAGTSGAPADELDLWFRKPRPIELENTHPCNFPVSEVAEDNHKAVKNMHADKDGFKCGALCLYLPGFAKAKPVRPKKEDVIADIGNVISRSVSLEKFECGSWASSAMVNDHEDSDSMNLYFDLPLESIQTSKNDATLPVAAAFIFDKDRKGVMSNSSTRAAAPRKSHESSRHFRFSASSPSSPASCITPRLRKAREDFNAFLEAQSA